MSTLVKHWWGWVRHITRPEPNGTETAYLDRYTARKQNGSGANPWRLYLHNFMAADSVGHHNHPSKWSFSLVLWGSYTEEVLVCFDRDGEECGPCLGWPLYVRTRRVRWWNWIPATKYHRITELHPGPGARGVWTLFVCSGLTGKGWGFWVPGRGHVPHTELEHTRVVESPK
jgi:hypothetical protein